MARHKSIIVVVIKIIRERTFEVGNFLSGWMFLIDCFAFSMQFKSLFVVWFIDVFSIKMISSCSNKEKQKVLRTGNIIGLFVFDRSSKWSFIYKRKREKLHSIQEEPALAEETAGATFSKEFDEAEGKTCLVVPGIEPSNCLTSDSLTEEILWIPLPVRRIGATYGIRQLASIKPGALLLRFILTKNKSEETKFECCFSRF